VYSILQHLGLPGATDDELGEALELQRRAQWRVDFIYSEGSRGFHASQEAAKILAESVDYALTPDSWHPVGPVRPFPVPQFGADAP